MTQFIIWGSLLVASNAATLYFTLRHNKDIQAGYQNTIKDIQNITGNIVSGVTNVIGKAHDNLENTLKKLENK